MGKPLKEGLEKFSQYILGLTVSYYMLLEFCVLFRLQLYYIMLFVLYIFMKYVK